MLLKTQMKKHGANLGASSTHLPYSLRTPSFLAEWLFEPGEELDTANELAVTAVSTRSSTALSEAGPSSLAGSAPTAAVIQDDLTSDRLAQNFGTRFLGARAKFTGASKEVWKLFVAE